ncbi:T9SS type A sorting domain-containing protein [candidate division KSB1 bacterium]|nr:T9SS type A sorting domain-containing protein [candidate division KSB1 bacterium]
MKRLLCIGLMLMAIPSLLSAQELVNGFNAASPDTNYWFIDSVVDSDTSGVVLTYTNEQVREGDNALRIDWSAQARQDWGGYTNIMHLAPDSTTYDFSMYTHLSLWYYNASPSSRPGEVEFRIMFKDYSEIPLNEENVELGEYWYSHHQILDSLSSGWNQILMPLEDVKAQTNQGFWLPGWAGAYGNNELNLDKIKGYKFEFSISSASYNSSDPAASGTSTGTIYLDDFRMVGHRFPVINYFDTTATATNYEVTGTGTSTLAITDNVQNYFEDVAAQFDWKVDANESWGGFVSARFNAPDGEFQPDMGGSTHLSLRYNNLVASTVPGNVVLRLQIYDYSEGDDQGEQWIYETRAVLDSAAGWHQMLIPLDDLGYGPAPNDQGFSNPGWSGAAGNSKLDWDKVRSYEFAFSGAQQGTVSEGTVLFDNLELYGFRETDFEAPAEVQGVSGVADANNYYNLVIWQDVPGETAESYDVFASMEPITDLEADGVEQIGFGIARGVQTLTHFLKYPLQDTDVTYYYAVRATDKAGNVGTAGVSSAVTNKAKGVATISTTPPANFAADGDLSEWQNSGITPFVFKSSTSHLGTGTFDNDDDLTATIYIAVDNEYLYIAADVIDDVFSYDPAGNWWEDDAIDFFIGLFDSRKGQNNSINTRGETPSYKLQIRADQLVNELNESQVIYTPDSTDYYFEGFNPDWVMETRIKLSVLQFGDDKPFVPENGMRIPFDISLDDSDSPNVRDGVLTYSDLNNDNSWQTARNWSYTWIGDQFTTPVEANDNALIPSAYELSQNYPNPFNPSTSIQYALPKTGQVSIVLFNTLGQKVKTLVDEVKQAGTHRIRLNATELPSGIYFYKIVAGDFTSTKKMIFMK